MELIHPHPLSFVSRAKTTKRFWTFNSMWMGQLHSQHEQLHCHIEVSRVGSLSRKNESPTEKPSGTSFEFGRSTFCRLCWPLAISDITILATLKHLVETMFAWWINVFSENKCHRLQTLDLILHNSRKRINHESLLKFQMRQIIEELYEHQISLSSWSYSKSFESNQVLISLLNDAFRIKIIYDDYFHPVSRLDRMFRSSSRWLSGQQTLKYILLTRLVIRVSHERFAMSTGDND